MFSPMDFYQPNAHTNHNPQDQPEPAPTAATATAHPATYGTSAGRHTRLAALSVLLLAAAGIGGAAASGAFRDRTPGTTTPASSGIHAHPAPPARHLPAGPRWVTTTALTPAHGSLTFTAHAVITDPASTKADPAHPGHSRVTVPQMGGYYALTNTGHAPFDLTEPVRLFAYWKVPAGMCRRWDPYWVADMTANSIPVVPAGHGQELCPMAWGDSTLDSIPQTLTPGASATLDIQATTLGVLGQDYPLLVANADAAVVARVTATPPAGWLALNEQLAPRAGHQVASTGLHPSD